MLIEKDYCDYETCVALKELGYNQPSIAFYPCQDIIVDCIDSNGELYEAEYDKGNLALYSSLNNKKHDINKVQAPLLYEAQKWLREEKEFYVFVGREWENTYYYWISKKFRDKTEGITHSHYYPNGEGQFSSYEEALSAGIKAAISILKDGKGI